MNDAKRFLASKIVNAVIAFVSTLAGILLANGGAN